MTPDLRQLLTANQLQTLRHMLGIDDPYAKTPQPYRDYYCANRGDENLHELARIGAVRLYSQRDGYDWYCCTDVGRAAAMASHKTIRKSKGSRLYSKFLDVRDCFPDLTFRQFLTEPDFKETRQNA